MANYVNFGEVDKILWSQVQPQPHSVLTEERKEDVPPESSQDKHPKYCFNTGVQHATDGAQTSSSHRADSVCSPVKDNKPANVDDGDEMNTSSGRSRAFKNVRAVFNQGGLSDSKSFHGLQTSGRPRVERTSRSRSFSPTVHSDGQQNGMILLAATDDSVSRSSEHLPQSQHKKVTLSRQKVIHTKRGSSGSPVLNLREHRKISREHKAPGSDSHDHIHCSPEFVSQDSSDSRHKKPKPRVSPRGSPEPKPRGSPEVRSQNSLVPKSRYSPEPKPRRSLEPGTRPVPAVRGQTSGRSREQKSHQEFPKARSSSTGSDKFEDALEYQPEDACKVESEAEEQCVTGSNSEVSGGGSCEGRKGINPNGEKSDSGIRIHAGSVGGRSGGSKIIVMDSSAGQNYEEAWDLKPNLEEKFRNLMRPRSNTVDLTVRKEESNYQEPWDTHKKQQELEEKIELARKGTGEKRQCFKSSSFVSPSNVLQPPVQGRVNFYEDAWDTKPGLSKMLASCGIDNFGNIPSAARSSLPLPDSAAESISSDIVLQNQHWYHGNISRDDSERMLRVCKDGSFLVRDSSDRCHYTLSIKSARHMIHIQIDEERGDNGERHYVLGKNGKVFPTIPTMIHHYSLHAVPIKGADHITLLYPVLRPAVGP